MRYGPVSYTHLAEDVLVPEKYDYDEQKLINNIIESRKKGKKHHIIINAEGIGPVSYTHLTTFLWHTVTDDCVPVENSLLFFNALRKFEIPVEMHLYPCLLYTSLLLRRKPF